MLTKKLTVSILVICLLFAGWWILKIILPPKEKVSDITLAQPEKLPAFIPHFLARENNFFREFMTDVSINTCSGGETPQESLARGNAHIAVMELADFLFAKCRHADLVAFAALTTGEPSFIMTRDPQPNFQWEDMEGKSIIGAPPESNAGILLEGVLRRHKMAPYRNVTVIYNIPPDLKKGAFLAENSTYLQASEPLASQLEAEGTARVVESLTEEKIPAVIYVTDRKTIARYPEKIQGFTRALYKTFLWMKYHPEQIARTVQPAYNSKDAELINTAVNHLLTVKLWPETPVINIRSMEEFEQMMLEAGELPGPVDCSKAVENNFAEEALKTVEYIPPEKEKKGLKKYWPFKNLSSRPLSDNVPYVFPAGTGLSGKGD